MYIFQQNVMGRVSFLVKTFSVKEKEDEDQIQAKKNAYDKVNKVFIRFEVMVMNFHRTSGRFQGGCSLTCVMIRLHDIFKTHRVRHVICTR